MDTIGLGLVVRTSCHLEVRESSVWKKGAILKGEVFSYATIFDGRIQCRIQGWYFLKPRRANDFSRLVSSGFVAYTNRSHSMCGWIEPCSSSYRDAGLWEDICNGIGQKGHVVVFFSAACVIIQRAYFTSQF